MGSGGSQPQQPVQKTTTEISPEAQQLFSAALPGLQTYAAGPAPQRYQGQVTPFTPTQEAAQSMALSGAEGQTGVAQRANDLAASIPGSLRWDLGSAATPYTPTPLATSSDIFSDPGIWNTGANPGLTAAINAATRPIYQNFQEQVLPQIRTAELSTGPFGGSRGQFGIAGGLAAGRANQAAQDAAAKMAQDEYNANLQAVNARYGTNIGAVGQRYGTDVGAETAFRGQNISGLGTQYGQNLSALYQTLGLTPTLQAAYQTPAATVGAVGDVQQAQNQAVLNDIIAQFNYNQPGYANYLKSKDILSTIPSMPGATTYSTGTVPQSNPYLQSLGGGLTGASLGMTLGGPIGAGIGAVGGAAMPFFFR